MKEESEKLIIVVKYDTREEQILIDLSDYYDIIAFKKYYDKFLKALNKKSYSYYPMMDLSKYFVGQDGCYISAAGVKSVHAELLEREDEDEVEFTSNPLLDTAAAFVSISASLEKLVNLVKDKDKAKKTSKILIESKKGGKNKNETNSKV